MTVAAHRNQIKSDVFSIFTPCKSLLFVSHLDMKRPGAHAEPLLFSPIVHLKAFFEGYIVKSEGLFRRNHAFPIPTSPIQQLSELLPRKQK